MKKEVIIFDKDGTLIDFDAFWVTLSELAIKDVLKNLNAESLDVEEFLNAIGVENKISDIDGILCKGTYEELGNAVWEVLKKHSYNEDPKKVTDMLLKAFNDNSKSGCVVPTCENIVDVLKNLKDSGRKLIVVTTDNYEITNMCLEKLGIKDFFEEIFADDGNTPLKPNPKCILDYCEKNNIEKDKVLMVGDTMTDINFAKNANISVVGVGKSKKNREKLLPYANAVIKDISQISSVLEEV